MEVVHLLVFLLLVAVIVAIYKMTAKGSEKNKEDKFESNVKKISSILIGALDPLCTDQTAKANTSDCLARKLLNQYGDSIIGEIENNNGPSQVKQDFISKATMECAVTNNCMPK